MQVAIKVKLGSDRIVVSAIHFLLVRRVHGGISDIVVNASSAELTKFVHLFFTDLWTPKSRRTHVEVLTQVHYC